MWGKIRNCKHSNVELKLPIEKTHVGWENNRDRLGHLIQLPVTPLSCVSLGSKVTLTKKENERPWKAENIHMAA